MKFIIKMSILWLDIIMIIIIIIWSWWFATFANKVFSLVRFPNLEKSHPCPTDDLKELDLSERITLKGVKQFIRICCQKTTMFIVDTRKRDSSWQFLLPCPITTENATNFKHYEREKVRIFRNNNSNSAESWEKKISG